MIYEIPLKTEGIGKNRKPIHRNIELLLFSMSVLNASQRCSDYKYLEPIDSMNFILSKVMMKNFTALGINKELGCSILKELENSFKWSAINVDNTSDDPLNKKNEMELFFDIVTDTTYALCDSISVRSEHFDDRLFDKGINKTCYYSTIQFVHNGNVWLFETINGNCKTTHDFYVNGKKSPSLGHKATFVASLFRLVASNITRVDMRQAVLNRMKEDTEVVKIAKHIAGVLEGDYETYLHLSHTISKSTSLPSYDYLKERFMSSYQCDEDAASQAVDVFYYPEFYK